MEFERFDHLKEKGITDIIMFDIVKYRMMPALNISFKEFVKTYGKKYKIREYPLWEVYLNILIWELGYSKESVEKAAKEARDSFLEETENNLRMILARYYANKKND